MKLLNTHCLDNHPEDSPVQCCADFWDVMRSGEEATEFFARLKREWWTSFDIETLILEYARAVAVYMLRPNWKHIDDRPVLYHAQCHAIPQYETDFGITPQEIVELIRQGVREVTGREVYLVALSTKPEFYPLLKPWGFDAFTDYLLYSDSWQNVMNLYRDSWARGVETAKQTGLGYWVPVTTGFDSSAWYPHPDRFVPTPEQFEAHLREAIAFSRKNWRWTRAQVCIESLNEFGEGSYIEPSIDSPEQLHPGTTMLEATRRAIG